MIPLTFIAGSGWRKAALGLAVAIAVAVLVALAAWRGYRAGYDRADAERRAEVTQLQAEHSQALAGAEVVARKRLQAETARANKLEEEYLAARKTVARQNRELTNRRIADASRAVVHDGCRFGPEWVRLYNQAIGAGDGGDAVSAPAPGPAGAAGTAGTAEARTLQPNAVTPEDILAHVRDYGRRCRSMEAQLVALIQWARGRDAVEVTP